MNSKRVLVVDDNEDVLEDYRKVLGSRRSAALDRFIADFFAPEDAADAHATGPEFDLACADQGQRGVDLVREALGDGRPFSIAFIDMRMPPGMDGRETIQRIRSIDPGLLCVVCTAFHDVDDERLRSEFGSNLVVVHKPFDDQTIRGLVAGATPR